MVQDYIEEDNDKVIEARAVHGNANVASDEIRNDSCGVRTHALTDWRLEPAP